jgi:EAL domain-containing protein (putative c-di-GMP-specific phosphodiesterase class I)
VVSINLSGMQFRQTNFRENIENIFAQTAVDPSLICLELTEGVIMGDAENTISTLHALKELGVKLSIDDFGTGYSSLRYLQKFPLDTLKIDRSFIMDIGQDGDDTAITEAIIAMGHSLGLQIIAEGVETQTQLDFLRERSCELIQGFFFSKPLPAIEIPAFAKTALKL